MQPFDRLFVKTNTIIPTVSVQEAESNPCCIHEETRSPYAAHVKWLTVGVARHARVL